MIEIASISESSEVDALHKLRTNSLKPKMACGRCCTSTAVETVLSNYFFAKIKGRKRIFIKSEVITFARTKSEKKTVSRKYCDKLFTVDLRLGGKKEVQNQLITTKDFSFEFEGAVGRECEGIISDRRLK